MKILTRTLIVLVVFILLFFIFLYSGVYNIGATSPHNKLTLWVISRLKDNSIEHYSSDIKVPNLDDTSMTVTGFVHYREMCVGCHGAPGIKQNEIGEGLYPKPPRLYKSIVDLTPQELFWITKNGIKMTGMPAFAPTHSDKMIWNIVAFMRLLPKMSAADYKSYQIKNKLRYAE